MPITARTVALATTLGLGMTLSPGSPSSAHEPTPRSASAARPALSMSPATGYLPGSDLTLTGTLGVRGRAPVVVQRNLGRAGDGWIDIAGSSATTRKNGSFVLHVPASGMNGIFYRVASTKSARATPPVELNAAIQETVVSAQGEAGGPVVRPGAPITFTVDTTVGSGSFAASPPVVGRTLTLQQRVDGFRWTTLGTSTTGPDGNGTMSATAPSVPGQAVYRVRQEEWNAGLDRIGWHASHPVYVTVGDDTSARAPRRSPEGRDASRSTAPPHLSRPATTYRSTAAATYKWREPSFDFDWEYGESLTTPPALGTRRRGWWSDYSDGTGRAAVRNGAALMSSVSEYGSRGSASLGSTWMTLNGNPRRFGRWETRVLPTGWGAGSTEMRVLVELVPSGAAESRCSASGIVLADYTPASPQITVGARSTQQWTRSVPTGSNNMVARAFAVEVGKQRITWFIDGRPVGSLKDKAALPTSALTLRVSLVGDHSGTNVRGKLGVDWVRGWTLKHGTQVRRKASFASAPNPVVC